jgi:hypothetical protein
VHDHVNRVRHALNLDAVHASRNGGRASLQGLQDRHESCGHAVPRF